MFHNPWFIAISAGVAAFFFLKSDQLKEEAADAPNPRERRRDLRRAKLDDQIAGDIERLGESAYRWHTRT